MFNFDQLEFLQLEITSRCQASCPMCCRNINGGLNNPKLVLSDWTFEDFKKIVTDEVLNQIKYLSFNGNLGDAIINDDLIDMCKYCVKVNPNVSIGIHTNGGARNKEWWKELANSLPKSHIVTFGIDGLEDTHHLYRIGTTYKKVISNATEFISSGGKAAWSFIKFKHNEHQVEEAYKRSIDLGFVLFDIKDTNRFINDPKFLVLDKQGNFSHFLEPPNNSKIVYIDNNIINNFKSSIKHTQINCSALNIKSIYIDAFKKIFPCSHLGSIPFHYYSKDSFIKDISDNMNNQYVDLLKKLKTNDVLNMSIKDIMSQDEWHSIWKEYWHGENKMIKCAQTCSKSNTFSSNSAQHIDFRLIKK